MRALAPSYDNKRYADCHDQVPEHACMSGCGGWWRWGDTIRLLWFATVDDDHCDCLSLRH